MHFLVNNLAVVRQALTTHGFYYAPTFSRAHTDVLELARALGSLYHPPGVDPDRPFIETVPAVDASYLAPFDRADGIGWHNDFSTHARRPSLSIAYLERADPRWPNFGAWRAVSCDLIFERLMATQEGTDLVHFLLESELPYSFTAKGDPLFFRVVERRGSNVDRLSLRFFGRALRDGARLVYGEIPTELEQAYARIESIADEVGHILAAPSGALLVTDNWHSLHDRLRQSIEPGIPLRRSLLLFVSEIHQ